MLLLLALLIGILLLFFLMARQNLEWSQPPARALSYAGPDEWYLPEGGDCRQTTENGYTSCRQALSGLPVWVAYLSEANKLEEGWEEPSFWEGPYLSLLRSYTRQWTEREGRLYIVTGPLSGPGNRPEAVFKVLLDLSEPEMKGIAFIVPLTEVDNMIHHYAVSIDSVEARTGLDLFPQLMTPELESVLESALDTAQWPTTAD